VSTIRGEAHLPFIVYATLVLLVSSLPRLPDPDLGIKFLDKLAHGLEYMIFALLGLRAICATKIKYNTTTRYAFFMLFSLAFAALDEWHQIYIPGRQADWLDFLSDSLGLGLGIILFWLFIERQNKTLK